MAATSETRSPAQLARDAFEAIFDRRDINAVRPLWNDDSVDHFPALGVDARGSEQLAAFFRELLAAVPDLEMTIENIVGDDRHAVVQWSLNGTFDGAPFQGIEPVGRPIALRGCDVFRFTNDGKRGRPASRRPGANFSRGGLRSA